MSPLLAFYSFLALPLYLLTVVDVGIKKNGQNLSSRHFLSSRLMHPKAFVHFYIALGFCKLQNTLYS